MKQLEVRILRLESLYLPNESPGFLWPEVKFLREFPKVFPDPNLAPPLARAAYFRLQKPWDIAMQRRIRANESSED